MAERARALEFIARLSEISGLGGLGDPDLVFRSLGGGRSGALVLLVAGPPISNRLDQRSTFIVKIAPFVKAAREKENYEQLVGPVLPNAVRPELLGFAGTSEFGALCFAAAHAGQDGDTPKTLTDHLADGSVRALDLVLRSICDALGSTWYDPAETRLAPGIADRYERRFFREKAPIQACEAKLTRDAALYLGAETQGGGYSIRGEAFPSPAAVLFEKCARRPYQSCVIHGDLNSDNLIVSPDRVLVNLVDFEHVGEGHALEDLASIEASIRINFPQTAPIGGIHESERRIAANRQPDPEDTYALAIANVRRAAIRLFGDIEASANYHFAIGALGLRLMQAVDLKDFARARIAASTLWATRLLADGS